jgi:hypothetical protein
VLGEEALKVPRRKKAPPKFVQQRRLVRQVRRVEWKEKQRKNKDALIEKIRSARSRQEVQDAQAAASACLEQHPDDEQVLLAGEQWVRMASALEFFVQEED